MPDFTTPVGRLVMGSPYKGRDKDAEGKPLVVKNGPNAGQPRLDYYLAVAIPKGSETHWNQTKWGDLIWQTGAAAFPQGQSVAPTFAWKVADGDSAVPNKRGNKPCDREGHRGHWVLNFSSSFPPEIYNADGSQRIQEPGAVKLGYYVQIAGNVEGNKSMSQPGVYLNHRMVALSAAGPEIVVGPDATSAGFGQSPLPPGATPLPVSPAVAAFTAPTAAPVTAPVTPHPGFLTAAPPPPAAPPPAAPPAPVRVMLPAAGGATYEAMISAGWTDAQLVQHGMMAP